MKVRAKICGITRPEDGRLAARLGAAAIGVVLAESSPRKVSPAQAAAICRAVPPFVLRVGLFMDQPADRVRAILDQVPLDWLQFHGSEPEDFCRSFSRPYIKAVAMAGDSDADYGAYADAAALLLDGHGPGEPGGSGKTFDWSRARVPDRPWILAGGLGPDNVAEAIARMRPPAVDVSSGVEAAPGIKDDKLLKRFMEAIGHG